MIFPVHAPPHSFFLFQSGFSVRSANGSDCATMNAKRGGMNRRILLSALVLAGFHLAGHLQEAVANITRQFRALDVRRAGPTHCTGEATIEAFHKAFGSDFIAMGVGRVLELE